MRSLTGVCEPRQLLRCHQHPSKQWLEGCQWNDRERSLQMMQVSFGEVFEPPPCGAVGRVDGDYGSNLGLDVDLPVAEPFAGAQGDRKTASRMMGP